MELVGIFRTVDQAAAAVERLLGAGIAEERVTSLTSVPYPDGVLVRRGGRSWFHWVALAGGALGACAGLALAVGTAWLYPLQTGDKPIIALFPAGIITYEIAMLFALVGTLVGMLLEMRLPTMKAHVQAPEIADGMIGICVDIGEGEREGDVSELFRQAGAVRVQSGGEGR